MRKTLKTLTAAILALVIAFGSFSAFAAEDKPAIKWNEAEYTYAGTLSEGKNSFEIPAEESFYVTFNAEKTGYYGVTYNWREINRFRSPEKIENGIVKETKKGEYLDINEDYDLDTYLFFFEEGENILASWLGYEAVSGDPSEVEVTYYGEAVSDISFEGGSKYFLVPEWNIYEYYDEEEKYPENSYFFEGGKTEITFDSDKKISLSYCEFICTAENIIETGENNVTVYYINETFEKTLSVYPISKEITSIEVEDIEKYLDVPVAYNGNLLYDFDGMKITLTYADGYKETLVTESGEWFGIDLRNGNPYYFPLDYFHEREDGNVYFCITVGGEKFIRAEGSLREATGRENRQHLNYRIYEIISDAAWDIRFSFDSIRWAENLWDGIVYLRKALFDSADEIFTAFENIVEEVAACIKG